MNQFERHVFLALVAFMDEHHYAPSLEQLAAVAGLSAKSTVRSHLLNLKRDGFVDFEVGLPRTLRILKREAA